MITISKRDHDAVIFDMDGVITDTARVHAASWKRIFDDYLREDTFTDDDYLRYVDGKPRDDGVEAFLASRGITLPRGSRDDPPDRETIWGLANRKNEQFNKVLDEQGVERFSSSVALVRALQQHGIGTAIISASRNAKKVLDTAGIGELFPVRVDGIELERLHLRGKPAPDVFLEAARRLDAHPARSVVVEDSIAGVDAGKAGGFGLVIGVDRVGHADALRAHGADVVVHDLAEATVA
jgi:alpha,alpha-trehalase